MDPFKLFIILCCIIFANGDLVQEEDGLLIDSVISNVENEDKGPGNPLFLTKYIEEGRLVKARRLATVRPFVGNVKSFSGYLTVDKRYNSNMLFWYFQSETDHRNAPTVVWLQGGPGCSMYLGVFNENGPYIINKNKISKREYAWSKISNMIYFDNPVGTGYSFTENDLGYATNETKVGKDLYEAMNQLYKLFPHMQKNDLYIAGESYAGKYVPALGHTIHIRNKNKGNIFFNLKGLLMGDAMTDPYHMVKYSKYLYEHGLIDRRIMHKFQKMEVKGEKLIKTHQWNKASQLFDKVIGGKSSMLYKYTGFEGNYNYINPTDGDWEDRETEFINSNYFRRHVHVGNQTLHDGTEVYKHLYEDIPKTVIFWVVDLLRHYRVLYYNGQLDIICAYPLTENTLTHMKWPLMYEYKKARRQIYRIKGEVAGYYKVVGNLMEALVRNAGHMVPANQPAWAFQLFSDFINNRFTKQ